MFISLAHAQAEVSENLPDIENALNAGATAAPDPSTAFLWNIGMIVVLVIMFYFLLIRPQQKRMKEHREMINSLKKGDSVVTAGGLVGKVHDLKDEREIVIDLGGNVKVTALRDMIQAKAEPQGSNDNKGKDKSKAA